MSHSFQRCLLSLCILVSVLSSEATLVHERVDENGVKSAVFLSSKIEVEAGDVVMKYYYNIDFPKGHIALKEFNAELVDELGNSILLSEAYLHHWLIIRYYAPKDSKIQSDIGDTHILPSDNIMVRNSGICPNAHGQYFGLGSETRGTMNYVPDPYGIEVGNPEDIPIGYEERWLVGIHVIDTRGVVDHLGCTECWCDLYNVTNDMSGKPLRPDYKGGVDCCHDGSKCRLREGFESIKRGIYYKYTVKWVDWEDTIVPVKVYILDVADIRETANDSTSFIGDTFPCQVEYAINSCAAHSSAATNGCIDSKRTKMVMPKGGYLVYGVAHQHVGAINATLFGEDGRVICSSTAIYGNGHEVGNEAGNLVGMTTCYPEPGSVKISDGETLIYESNYSSTQYHPGVMGLFYLLVAEQTPKPTPPLLGMPVHVVPVDNM